MIACLSVGPLMRYGKWNIILATNLMFLVAIGLMMINSVGLFLFARFLYGMTSGTFTVVCPKFVNEIVPEEYKGPFGTMS